MSRVAPVAPEKAKDRVKDLYETLTKKMGRVANIFQNMGNSPAVLEGYLNFSEVLNKTTLSPKLRELIALAVAEVTHCQYCLSAHTTIGGSLGLKPQEILQARQGEAAEPKTQVILQFAKKVVESKAQVTNEDVEALKLSGVSDKELVEIIMVIVFNLFTNYFNIITDPKVDFPEAPKINLMAAKL